jgi:hypothetical protein
MMQGVLCAILGLTVLLAWWVGHTRGRALAVTLDGPAGYPAAHPMLSIRFPKGWAVVTHGRSSPWSAVAQEQGQSEESAPRVISVSQRRLSGEDLTITSDEFANNELTGRERPSPRGRIDFLGAPGVIIEVPAQLEQDDDGTVRRIDAELYAFTVNPTSRIAVAVKLSGPSAFAPGDYDLLRSVAQSLKPISSATRPALPSDGGGRSRQ